jgi:hypothetical protein
MKKLLLFFILTLQIFAQNDSLLKKRFHNSFLYFLPNSDNLISLIVKAEDNDSKNKGSNLEVFSIAILSKNDGSIINEIPLSDPRAEFIYAFNVSHDGLSFVALLAPTPNNVSEWHKGPFIIKKYLINENRWDWEREWYDEVPSLLLAFSEADKQIIGVSTQNTIIIDAETGTLVRKSKLISSVGDYNYPPHFDLSSDGKYFAYFWNKYLRWSLEDESGILRLLDLTWYGLRWLYHFGSIPNYLYVWDVYEDTLYCEFQIPYEVEGGIPIFTEDESKLLTEDFDFEYQEYSITDKKLIKKFEQSGSGYPEITEYSGFQCKAVSPDNNFFAETYSGNILVIDYDNGQIINKYKRTNISYNPTYRYAMAFSPDSKYFAVVTSSHTDTVKTSQYNYTVEKGNKINLFETQSWEKIWEKDLSKKE